ncbi:hypothetical protein ASG36_15105 [Geodermatophilus sp. Leaf369]|uniref:GNAT family N-acetyltransferase n=1 Tax=Geodermatophilus sp. Leaf369 TaxID=1736354 RepID=UPI0006FCDF6F|nr:GNAT family N-acetyltransferase [Geodermatophilus sp. Leaf369]KQS57904.1 hypothetical protein ASG36_15105 [Geodermatophilus sp. Leaf369]
MITLRPLQREDLALPRSWLDEPLVRRWWADDSSAEAVEAQYGPSVDGTDPTRVWVVLDDGAPVGLVQGYRWADEPAELAAMATVWPVPDGAVSVDYLLGVPSARGRGVGPALVSAAVAELQALYPDARDVVVPVHAENRRSWRALEKAGFTRVAEGELEPDDPADSRDHVVYRLEL